MTDKQKRWFYGIGTVGAVGTGLALRNPKIAAGASQLARWGLHEGQRDIGHAFDAIKRAPGEFVKKQKYKRDSAKMRREVHFMRQAYEQMVSARDVAQGKGRLLPKAEKGAVNLRKLPSQRVYDLNGNPLAGAQPVTHLEKPVGPPIWVPEGNALAAGRMLRKTGPAAGISPKNTERMFEQYRQMRVPSDLGRPLDIRHHGGKYGAHPRIGSEQAAARASADLPPEPTVDRTTSGLGVGGRKNPVAKAMRQQERHLSQEKALRGDHYAVHAEQKAHDRWLKRFAPETFKVRDFQVKKFEPLHFKFKKSGKLKGPGNS